MSRKAKGSGFKMRSGNTTPFKEMGSSPLEAGDSAIIAAATPDETVEPIDFTIDVPEIDVPDNKKKKKEKEKDDTEEENGEEDNGEDNGDDSGDDDSE